MSLCAFLGRHENSKMCKKLERKFEKSPEMTNIPHCYTDIRPEVITQTASLFSSVGSSGGINQVDEERGPPTEAVPEVLLHLKDERASVTAAAAETAVVASAPIEAADAEVITIIPVLAACGRAGRAGSHGLILRNPTSFEHNCLSAMDSILSGHDSLSKLGLSGLCKVVILLTSFP